MIVISARFPEEDEEFEPVSPHEARLMFAGLSRLEPSEWLRWLQRREFFKVYGSETTDTGFARIEFQPRALELGVWRAINQIVFDPDGRLQTLLARLASDGQTSQYFTTAPVLIKHSTRSDHVYVSVRHFPKNEAASPAYREALLSEDFDGAVSHLKTANALSVEAGPFYETNHLILRCYQNTRDEDLLEAWVRRFNDQIVKQVYDWARPA